MEEKITDKLIISLIKDDLINSKLVDGLIDLGIDAGCYFLHLDITIFRLIGYGDDDYSEGIYEKYRDLAKQAKQVDISNNNSGLDPLALDLYQFLLCKRPNR